MERAPFEEGEWYHCYNRGIDKRSVFETEGDYVRFLQLLWAANSMEAVRVYNTRKHPLVDLLKDTGRDTLTDIGAFCLMPNHFHLLLREKSEGGITTFMRKLGTAYTMYFNIKNARTGNLFNKPFRSKHVHDDRYLQYVVQYIHCNPAELKEPRWKEGEVSNLASLEKFLSSYRYSSLGAFSAKGLLRPILSKEIFSIWHPVTSNKMVEEALAYYSENPDLD